MTITSPFFDSAGQHIVFEINGGPAGWLVTVQGELDSARPCETLDLAVESIVNYTATMAQEITTDHCIDTLERFVSQGLVSKDAIGPLRKALRQETTI